MPIPRRAFLQLAGGTAAAPVAARLAWGETYPARPVHVLVGFPAGNAPDIVARLIGQWLSQRLGQQFVIENRPGASSNIATEDAVNAPPDGYTLLMAVLTNVLNAVLYQNLKFNFGRDLAPVACIADAPYVIVLNPAVPVETVADFIAYAKANPGKINMASGGNGTSTHIFGELFQMMTGVELVHVPYRGSYMTDLIGGAVQVVFNPIPQSLEFIRAGKLRALAVTTATRLPALPDVPTVSEFVPGYQATGWYGIVVTGSTPAAVIDNLNREINAGLADAGLAAQLASLGVAPMPMTPAQFGKFIVEETEKWATVVRFAGIKAE